MPRGTLRRTQSAAASPCSITCKARSGSAPPHMKMSTAAKLCSGQV